MLDCFDYRSTTRANPLQVSAWWCHVSIFVFVSWFGGLERNWGLNLHTLLLESHLHPSVFVK
jgi:hypothetical protein